MGSETERMVRSLGIVAVLLSSCLALAACNGTSHTNPPHGVSVSLIQERSDVTKDQLALKVTNLGDDGLTVTQAILESKFFAEPLVWEGATPTVVAPGRSLDLRVDIPRAVCDSDASDAIVVLTLDTGPYTVIPEDTTELVERLHRDACFEENVSAVAVLAAERLELPPSLPSPALLIISAQPTGARGAIVIEAMRGTTLLSPAIDGLGVDELTVDQVVDAGGPTEVQVPIVPNRCDPHALAEDKVGTAMPLLVTGPDGGTSRLTLIASDELRGQMYAFYLAFCGL